MLRNINMSKALDKSGYKESAAALGMRLGELQRQCRAKNIPVMILFDGWSAAGKGTRIGSLIRWLDPRGFEVYTIQAPSEEERLRPYMWRFWQRTPAAGRFHIFDRSWYRILLRDHDKKDGPAQENPVRDILSFERQLVDAGVVIVKLFLHISKNEQKKRLASLEKDSRTAWRVTKSSWKQNQDYDRWLSRFEQAMEKTDHDRAKWIIVEADNANYADIKVYQAIADALDDALQKAEAKSSAKTQTADSPALPPVDTRSSVLTAINPHVELDQEDCRRRMNQAQADLGRHHSAMYKHRVPAVIVFEGWDAAGKGGAIKRLVATLDPRGYEVVPSGAPNDIERAHHYLWRYWNKVPKAGHLTVFDRSWYGRVMVERVEGFCTQEEWRRAFREINDFEEQLVEGGNVLIKFWLHIDQEEQLRRFEARTNSPEKQWKITDEDWRNRAKWDKYMEAVDEMLLRTSTTYAPWTIVEANAKPFARAKVVDTVQEQLANRLKG